MKLNVKEIFFFFTFFLLPKVLIYTDDFKSERADRERAQGQIDALKEQVSQLKQQLHKQVRQQPCT